MEQQETPPPPKATTERKDKTSYKEWKQKIISNIDVLANAYNEVIKNPDFTPQNLMDKCVKDKIKDQRLNNLLECHLSDLAYKRKTTKTYQKQPEKLRADIASLYPAIKIGENSRVEWHNFGVFIIVNQEIYKSIKSLKNTNGAYIPNTTFILINEENTIPKEVVKKHELFHLGFDPSSAFPARWHNAVNSFKENLSEQVPFSILKMRFKAIISRYFSFSKEEALAEFISDKSNSTKNKERAELFLTKLLFAGDKKSVLFAHPTPNELFLKVINMLEDEIGKNPNLTALLEEARQAEIDQRKLLSAVTKMSAFLKFNENLNSEEEYKKNAFFFLLLEEDKLDYGERYLEEYKESKNADFFI